MLQGRAAVQRDPDRNLMKSSKVKCQFLSLGRRNCRQTYRVGPDGFRSSSAGKDLWVLVDSKMNMSQSCTLASNTANSILGCINSLHIERSYNPPLLGTR